jgi:UDP-N-acetylmuramate dehydrogenase
MDNPRSVRGELVEPRGGAPLASFDKLRTNGVRGKLTEHAPLAKLVWFKSGGNADWLFEPEDLDDLLHFLAGLDEDTPVMALGLGAGDITKWVAGLAAGIAGKRELAA